MKTNVEKFIWKKFNKLTILNEVKSKKRKDWRKNTMVKCKCECGKNVNIALTRIINWYTKSCWCLQIIHAKKLQEINCKTHWMYYTRLNNIWSAIKQRCNNKTLDRYGWRWITYDKKRETFDWFINDMLKWYSDELSIDRIDNDWNYNKENCRRATAKEQANNRKERKSIKLYNINWKIMDIKQIAELYWINKHTLECRLLKWWDIKKSISYIRY